MTNDKISSGDAVEQLANKFEQLDEEIDELETKVNDQIGTGPIDSEQLAEAVRAELERLGIPTHAETLTFPARKEGPTKPSGPYHSAEMWGIQFTTGSSCYLRSARIDAEVPGTFTATVGRYDGNSFDPVDTTEITVDEPGDQRVDLDLDVPEAGRYLLTRTGSVPLKRSSYSGWDDHTVDNLKLVSGAKPDELGGPDIDTSDNTYWYYYFDLELVANENHAFPG